MSDALAGRLPLAIGTVMLGTPHVKGGQLKALAVTSGKADEQLCGVKPPVEQGVPGFEALAWWGCVRTGGHAARDRAQDVRGDRQGAEAPRGGGETARTGHMAVLGGGPEELDRFVRSEITRWGEVLRDNKIKAGD